MTVYRPATHYGPRGYDFPQRVATPELAKRELARLSASYAAAHEHRDPTACRYLAARMGRAQPYLRAQQPQPQPAAAPDPQPQREDPAS